MIAAYALLACIVCCAFAAAALHAIDRVEDALIDKRLARTAEQLARRLAAGQMLDLPPSVTLYRGDALPPVLRDLAAGRHELSIDGASANVLVHRADGLHFVLTDADAEFEAIKMQLYALLSATFVGCLGLAVVLGRTTANHVIAPVTALAQAVEKDQLADDCPSLNSSDELGVLARAFASRTQDLRQLLLREQWFVADVSHELRTPLTVIIGAAELLQSRAGAHPELVILSERIRRTAADTAAQVSALLLLSRQPETLDAPRVALAPIIRQEMERCKPLLQGKDVSLTFDVACEVELNARSELVGTAVGNLIRNACQYTEHGSVVVRLERGRLVVRDTGVGIPAGVRDQVFERFVRADLGQTPGSGLGLAIVRRVAQHLGWQARLEDSAGVGSCFALIWKPEPEALPSR